MKDFPQSNCASNCRVKGGNFPEHWDSPDSVGNFFETRRNPFAFCPDDKEQWTKSLSVSDVISVHVQNGNEPACIFKSFSKLAQVADGDGDVKASASRSLDDSWSYPDAAHRRQNHAACPEGFSASDQTASVSWVL